MFFLCNNIVGSALSPVVSILAMVVDANEFRGGHRYTTLTEEGWICLCLCKHVKMSKSFARIMGYTSNFTTNNTKENTEFYVVLK